MLSPVAKFFPQDKMTVVFGTLTIYCEYWVEWGDDRWHVQVERLDEKGGGEIPSFECVSELIKGAIGRPASRRILVEEKRPNQAPEPTSGSVAPRAQEPRII
jgi:hypothetical protein